MRYEEIDLCGVYVAPIALMMLAAWMALIAARFAAARFGLLRHVWHPALFLFATYLILLTAIVLLVGEVGS
jgi:hypothetical protein